MKAWVKGVIAGAVIAAVGVIILIIGLYMNGWKFTSVEYDFETKTYTAEQDDTSVDLQLNASRLKTEFYDGEKIVIEYPYAEKYASTVTETNGTLSFASPKIKWFKRMFGFSCDKIPTTVIKLPQNKTFNLTVSLNAGDINIADGEYGNLGIEVNAGALTVGTVICKNFDCEVNAGSATADGLTCETADLDVSAGSCNVKNVNCPNIGLDVSAGTLRISVVGAKTEYNIAVDKSAGSCNVVSQKGSTDKTVIIDVSAGTADVSFIN